VEFTSSGATSRNLSPSEGLETVRGPASQTTECQRYFDAHAIAGAPCPASFTIVEEVLAARAREEEAQAALHLRLLASARSRSRGNNPKLQPQDLTLGSESSEDDDELVFSL
jgi:hypothetical protein